jgi:hypothetical protein
VFIVLAVACVFCDIMTFVNFVEGNLLVGFISLNFSVAFAFTSGLVLSKAILVNIHNKEVEFLQYIHEELKKEVIKDIEPFDELTKHKGEGK